MRIGTWNVEYGFGLRNPDRLDLLRTHAADIWVLTETHRDLDLSPTHFSVSSDPRPLPHQGSTWVTIWSRVPVRDQLPVPDPCRMVAALLETPRGPLAVAGVVLPWHSDRGDQPPDPPPKNWSEHLRVLRDQLPGLLQSLRIAPRRVFAGDLNTDLAPPHACGVREGRNPYRYGIAEGRRMLSEMLKEEALVCHTEQVLYPTMPPRTLIDHVCTNLGLTKAVETWPGEDGKKPRLSDHPGVVVSIAELGIAGCDSSGEAETRAEGREHKPS